MPEEEMGFATKGELAGCRPGPASARLRLEAAVEDLEGRGVEFPAGISEHDWGRVTTFKDSEGNNLQLYEPPQD